MALSDIKSIKVTEKRSNPNGQIVFDNYLKSFVSNYGVSWILNNDQTLSIFNYDSPPVNLPGIDKVYRGYAVGGAEKRLLASAYSSSMPKDILDLTGIKDIDGSHVHGLAITNDNKITGWTMTGWAYPMGVKSWVTPNQGSLWRQSRVAATSGAYLTGVKKIAADFQASFALLEGDILTGWGCVGEEVWINPGYDVGRFGGPAAYFIDQNKHATKWNAFNFYPMTEYGNGPGTVPLMKASPGSVKWNWINKGIACYESGNATHVVDTNSLGLLKALATYRWGLEENALWTRFWPDGLPFSSGKFSSYVQSNYNLSMFTVSGGNNWITTSGYQTRSPNPYTPVTIGGGPRAWVGGFLYVKPSTDQYGNPTLWGQGFQLKSILLEKGGDIWVTTDTGFQNWSTKGINNSWKGLAYNNGALPPSAPYYNRYLKYPDPEYGMGQYMVAFPDSGNLWVSNNSGDTWTQKGPSQKWSCVHISDNGRYQVAGSESGYLWKSEDFGQNWFQLTNAGIRKWKSVQLSGPVKTYGMDNGWAGAYDTGQRYITRYHTEAAYISAAAEDSFLVSYDSGNSWVSKLNNSNFYSNNNLISGPTNIIAGELGVYSYADGYKLLPASGLMFGADDPEGVNCGFYTGPASPSIPLASYPYLYLTGVKDFDIGQNYLTILLKTGSNDTYQLTGWGSRPARLVNDNLKEVKKVISNRDHSFAIIKSGQTSIITGWGLDETNISQFEQFVWSYQGGIYGWFSGFRNDFKNWTGVKDIDIGFNHGIAVFEDDKVSGWASKNPPYNPGLVAQINNKYKNIDEREINFFAPNYTTTDQELFFKNDITDSWEFKFNTFLDKWTFEVNSQIAYLSNTAGIDGLLGAWQGTGTYSGQELSVVNDTVQYIYPVEMGEAYISAMPDRDWISLSTSNVIFPWNKTVAYLGGGAAHVDVFNLPAQIYYNESHGLNTLNCSSPLGCPCDYPGALATFPTSNTIIPILNTFGQASSWVTGSISGNISSIAISDSGTHQTAVMSGGKIYVSNNTGITWLAKESNRNWSNVSMTRDGKFQTAIISDLGKIWYSNNNGASWSEKGSQRNWEKVTISHLGDTVFAIDKSGEIYAYGTVDMWGNEQNVWEEQIIQDWYGNIPIVGKPKAIAFDIDYKNLSIACSGGYITSTNNWGTTWQNRSISGNWSDIAMSFNGRYQTATINGGSRYISTDSGVTWSSRGPVRNWAGVAMSADGKYQSTIVSKDGFYSSGSAALGSIYYSRDFGDTWSLSTPFGSSFTGINYKDIAVSHDAINQVAVGLNSSILKSKVSEDVLGSVRLYPSKDFPLTVYRELSGALSSDPVRFDKNYEIFLSQARNKDSKWSISLRYRANSYNGTTSIQEENLVQIPRSIDKTGYALPPSGNWPSFFYRNDSEPCAAKSQSHSGLFLSYSIITGGSDSRTGYMQDLTFSLNYKKMLPSYSNKEQIYRYNDGYFNYSNFGGNISVEDATKCHKVLDFQPLLNGNTDWAINVAKFSSDSGVNWNNSVTKPNCTLSSTNIYGPLTETPPRSKSSNNWYILLKYFGPTGWSFNSTTGYLYWPGASIIDKSSGARTNLTAEVYNPLNLTWANFQTGSYQISSGACYHYQIRLSHPDLNVSSGSLDRNFWSGLIANCYSGGYYWNNIEDQSTVDNSSLVLQRGREYRFIQNGPINTNNKLKIHPASGVEVFEYDSDNPSEYHYIRLKIDSENKNDQFINWSKGDRSYITGFTGSHTNARGNYVIGNFYEINSSGIVLDPANPNFKKYALNSFTGNWSYLSGESKILGSIKYDDKIYQAEFWRLSGNQSFSTWPNNLNNGTRISTAYAFIQTGDVKIPFYGIMEQTAKNININIANPSGDSAGQRSIWNGKFKIAGKNEYSVAANYFVEYPAPGQYTAFDMHICTDYNEANNPLSWPYLNQSAEIRSGLAYFSGVNTTGYFFKNRDNRFYSRKNILTQRNTINNIWFIPTTHARFEANELAFWTGLSANGPWGKVETDEASLWGGTSNFYNVNHITYPDPDIKALFGELWQLIQFYIPSNVNISNVHIKIGPKSGDPTCIAPTSCRFTNISILEDGGLPFATENGYYQNISGQDRYIGIKDFYLPSTPLFSGNINVWSSDIYFRKQIPLGIKGPIDYIK